MYSLLSTDADSSKAILKGDAKALFFSPTIGLAMTRAVLRVYGKMGGGTEMRPSAICLRETPPSETENMRSND